MGRFPSLSALADLLPLILPEKAQREVSYGFDRWFPEVHLITVAPLCTTASEKSWSLIAKVVGARHAGLGLTDSCEESD